VQQFQFRTFIDQFLIYQLDNAMFRFIYQHEIDASLCKHNFQTMFISAGFRR